MKENVLDFALENETLLFHEKIQFFWKLVFYEKYQEALIAFDYLLIVWTITKIGNLEELQSFLLDLLSKLSTILMDSKAVIAAWPPFNILSIIIWLTTRVQQLLKKNHCGLVTTCHWLGNYRDSVRRDRCFAVGIFRRPPNLTYISCTFHNT